MCLSLFDNRTIRGITKPAYIFWNINLKLPQDGNIPRNDLYGSINGQRPIQGIKQGLKYAIQGLKYAIPSSFGEKMGVHWCAI